MRLALLVLVVAVAAAGCSPRPQPQDGLLHRILPTEEDLPEWRLRAEDELSADLPSQVADTPACRALDELHGSGARSFATRRFSLRKVRSVGVEFYAEELPAGVWDPGLEYLRTYFQSSHFGRCMGDALEGQQAGSRVTESASEPGFYFPGTASAAWDFTLDGNPKVLRHEVIFWIDRGFVFGARVMRGETDDVGPIEDAIEVFRTRVSGTIPRITR